MLGKKTNEKHEINNTYQIKYNTDDKKKLKDKILRLYKYKDRTYIINVSKIILKNTDNYSNNSNGIFTFFHDLSDKTYENIDDYLINIEKNRNKKFIKNLTSDFSDTIVDSDNLVKNIEIDSEKYLTNKEKVIMRRKNYEKYLDINQE
jgi:hypothetical protein